MSDNAVADFSWEASPLGDSAIILRFGEHPSPSIQNQIQHTLNGLLAAAISGVTDLVPAYTTLTVHYNCQAFSSSSSPYQACLKKIKASLSNPQKTIEATQAVVTIPVCYEPAFAPDIEQVATHSKLSVEEVIKRHTQSEYQVVFIGFSPGFPFLTGLDPTIAMPRKATPRLQVSQGSVGIAGIQTGIYPLTSPGGWQIIGQTPIELVNFSHYPPCYLQAGDRVRFYSITSHEFNRLREKK